MTQEEQIFIHELPLLLNYLESSLSVSYPLYEFDLFSARPDGNVYLLGGFGSREMFEDARASCGTTAQEMPAFNDLLSCLMNSGILPYANRDAFEEKLRMYNQLKKGVRFGPDTNVFYHGLPLNAGIDPAAFLLVDTVKNEIESSMNYKYSPKQIADFKRTARYQKQLLDELVNARTKRARLAAHLALPQFRAIRDRATMVPALEPSSSDKEANDLIIVRSLKAFEKEKFALPVMLTADRNLATLCDAEGVEHFLFEMPAAIGKPHCTPAAFTNLLATLAGVLGFIQCNSAVIFGEYRGKGGRSDELKVQFLNETLIEPFRKDLTICRKLQALNIAI
ncbi:MAG: PIN domain-containing protein [Methanoregula sp.]|nr:MAG: PIN domain-containing protein [Methanoregula sp.]